MIFNTLTSILACSGSRVFIVIAERQQYAFEHLLFAAGLAVLSGVLWVLLRRYKALPMVVVALLAIHPYMTVSGTGGDCGRLKAELATTFTMVAGLCVVIQLVAWLRPGLARG